VLDVCNKGTLVPLRYVMCCGNQKQHLCNVKSKQSNIPEVPIMEVVLYLGCNSCNKSL